MASCEETSWSSSLMASFSWEMVASFWDTPLSSWEIVTSPLTSWDRRVMALDLVGMVLTSVWALKSGRSRGLR